MMPPIVALKGVSKTFRSVSGQSIVLEGVDLTIESGQKVSLVGPSGSGKSTLLALIAGLLRPDAGAIEIDGLPLSDLNEDERAALRARRIGIALQAENLIPFLTALENVELALGFGGRRMRKERACELLAKMGVAHRAGHLPRQLSGGEAQRVALAVALANEPAILLADEMVSQLDEATASTVMREIFDLEMAVLFVTHDPTLADRADVQLRLRNRRVERR